jgi:hypothetical protein
MIATPPLAPAAILTVPLSWTRPAWPAPAPTPLDLNPSWIALHSPWREETAPDPATRGAARWCWDAHGLRGEFVFPGAHQRNRATRLNQRTWETGDAGECFVQVPGTTDYLEIHLTPENQRLQLRWTADGLGRVRQKQARLDDYLVADPGWVQSRTRCHADWWSGILYLPADRLGFSRLSAGLTFRAAVCRYHYRAPGAEPELSTTAPLTSPHFHQPAHWQQLVLQSPPSAPAAA